MGSRDKGGKGQFIQYPGPPHEVRRGAHSIAEADSALRTTARTRERTTTLLRLPLKSRFCPPKKINTLFAYAEI